MTTNLLRAVHYTTGATARTLQASPSCSAQRIQLHGLRTHGTTSASPPRHFLRCSLSRPGPSSGKGLTHRPALPGLTLLGLALTEESPVWTLDQIAGLAFGGIMLASVLTASKVDEYIARAQRRDLGLCEECGGVNEPETCDQNKCPYNKKHT